jgi:toxin ParE1/3/4
VPGARARRRRRRSRVTRRPLAALDILDIWDYIAEDSVAAADQWLDKLDEKFNLIATQPLMGRAREELAAGLRSFPFGRYVIFYVPFENGIDVVRVLHGARDIDAVFEEGQ